ncbi:MAG: DUF1016 N-terminal domain-containing protein [Gammaproteobacteria bacterium]|jgi:hypothetical protein
MLKVNVNLYSTYPGLSGFSKHSLEYMRLLATLYPSLEEFTQQAAAQLPWSYIQLLLDKYRDDSIKREWYASRAIENGLNVNLCAQKLLWSSEIVNFLRKSAKKHNICKNFRVFIGTVNFLLRISGYTINTLVMFSAKWKISGQRYNIWNFHEKQKTKTDKE